MEPELQYFPINNREDIFFSTIYCIPCEQPERSELRAKLLEMALTNLKGYSNFIETGCTALKAFIERLPKDNVDTVVTAFMVQQGITHLRGYEERFNAVVTRALGLQKNLVETNNEVKPTEEKCRELFAELVGFKQASNQLEREISVALDHQKTHHRVVVLTLDPQEKMPEKIDMDQGKNNTYVENSLQNVGMAVAGITVPSINVFLCCIKGLEAKSKI